MKRLSFIVMAGLIALGLTQCKKNDPTNNDTEGVKITLNINNGGGRMQILEGTNHLNHDIVKVLYEKNDVIYVGSHGSYVGYLTCQEDGTTFTGTISGATENEPLQFIYLGGHTATENRAAEFAANPTAPFTFSLEDQSFVLHVVSTAASNETFASTTTSYTLAGGKMRNQCALVKFTFNEGNFSSAEEATINGVYNHLNIGFDGSVSTITSNGKGDIATFKSTTNNAVHFAVVPATEENLSGDIYIEGYEGTYSIEAPSNNAFIQLAVTLTTEPASNFTEKPFTIDETGKTVYFSRSNAHFDQNRWYLAANQYDYEETWRSNEPVSHFAWGTWGNYSNPNTPSNIIDNSDYYNPKTSANGYTYVSQYDGSFQGNIPGETGTWRVMTQEEWNYLFNVRTVNSGRQPYGFGKVYGRNGLIVLPDDWDGSADPDFQYGPAYGWPNDYRGSKWKDMELAGAVFLPAAGYRLQGATTSGTTYYHSEVWNTDILGGYWSSTKYPSSWAYLMYFEDNKLNTARTDYSPSFGFCVRFVKAAN